MKKLVEKLKEFFGKAKVRCVVTKIEDGVRTKSRDLHNWFIEHLPTMKTLCIGVAIGLLISLKTLVKCLLRMHCAYLRRVGV